MIIAETAAVVLIAANLVIWGSLSPRVRRFFRRVPAAPFLEPHPGRHVASQPRDTRPLTVREIERADAGAAPWEQDTAENPLLTDEATREMYFGKTYGQTCQLEVEAQRIPQVIALWTPPSPTRPSAPE